MDIDALFEGKESTIQKDMKLNFKKFYSDSKLDPKTATLITLACAEAVHSRKLREFSEKALAELGATGEEIAEAQDIASLMATMNMYYRFRHFVEKDAYKAAAGLRMNAMARPATGKQTFEMMALAVSIINGCEMCVKSHEKSLTELGVSEDQIHDLARLASVIKGIEPILR